MKSDKDIPQKSSSPKRTEIRFSLKLISVCILFFFSLPVVSCIKPQDKTAITDIDKKKTMIYGYGYSRGGNEIGVEMFARQRAKLAIAEQLRGSSFTILKKDGTIVFTTETGLLELPGIKTESSKTWQRKGEWESLIIVSAELEVAVPRGKGMIDMDIEITDDDGTFTLALTKEEAVLAAWRETGQTDPAPGEKNHVTGHVYVTGLEIKPADNDTGVVIHIKYGIIFD